VLKQTGRACYRPIIKSASVKIEQINLWYCTMCVCSLVRAQVHQALCAFKRKQAVHITLHIKTSFQKKNVLSHFHSRELLSVHKLCDFFSKGLNLVADQSLTELQTTSPLNFKLSHVPSCPCSLFTIMDHQE
jgi:hypothetical protein